MLCIYYLYANILFNALSYVCLELYKITVYRNVLLAQLSPKQIAVCATDYMIII